jgi:hypothetical protein
MTSSWNDGHKLIALLNPQARFQCDAKVTTKDGDTILLPSQPKHNH